MSEPNDEPTLIEEFESSPAGAQEMAGARFAVEVLGIPQRAMGESHMAQQQLSESLDLTPALEVRCYTVTGTFASAPSVAIAAPLAIKRIPPGARGSKIGESSQVAEPARQ